MPRARPTPPAFAPNLLALSVAACFASYCAPGQANPSGATVTSGSASFNSAGNTLTVTSGPNAIINWQSFSIGVNETTRFVQGSSASAVLNRVVGANGVIPQSVIDGVLSSNGRVFLLNQSGVVIGQSARIDVAGLVVSSLNLSDRDFLDGRLRFGEVSGAGAVANRGTIRTPSGGRVFLVAPEVENSGVVRTPQGEIVLAAGKSVELVSEASPYVSVRVTADGGQALNLGTLVADAGRVGMYGALVRHAGVAEANGAVVGEHGEIRLVASKDLRVDAGSVVSANGPSGGDVLLQAKDGTNLVAGAVEAKGAAGQGGRIDALGTRVGIVDHAVLDASGETGGGTVRVGGDYKGANPDVQNAQRTLVGPDASIRADAGSTGDGGRVTVWADGDTRFYGSISARGGERSGNGGSVETSGHDLDAAGSVDTRAPNGRGGEWLLDPFDISISATGTDRLSGSCAPASICFDDPGPTVTQGLEISINGSGGGSTTFVSPFSDVSVATINTGLRSNGSVTLQARHDIQFFTDLVLAPSAPGQSFTAQAGHDVSMVNHNIVSNGANITMRAMDQAAGCCQSTGLIASVSGGGNITTGGGNVTLSGVFVEAGNINTSGGPAGSGSVTITSLYGDIMTGSITTASTIPGVASSPVTLSTAARTGNPNVDRLYSSPDILVSGNIKVEGDINSRGFLGGRGGDVTLQRGAADTAGVFTVNGRITAWGGLGAVGSPVNRAGDGGNVVVSLPKGDLRVAFGINAEGGNGQGNAGNPSGAGGTIQLAVGGSVRMDTGVLEPNVIQVSIPGGMTGFTTAGEKVVPTPPPVLTGDDAGHTYGGLSVRGGQGNGSGGSGGSISVSANSFSAVGGVFATGGVGSSGARAGDGGVITIRASAMSFDSGVNASGGFGLAESPGGSGGSVTLATGADPGAAAGTGSISFHEAVQASGSGGSSGGHVSIVGGSVTGDRVAADGGFINADPVSGKKAPDGGNAGTIEVRGDALNLDTLSVVGGAGGWVSSNGVAGNGGAGGSASVVGGGRVSTVLAGGGAGGVARGPGSVAGAGGNGGKASIDGNGLSLATIGVAGGTGGFASGIPGAGTDSSRHDGGNGSAGNRGGNGGEVLLTWSELHISNGLAEALIFAGGGAGGAGGPGTATIRGGDGGNGGNGGAVRGATVVQIAAQSIDVSGGAGGAGGSNGGAGPGLPGTPGQPGTANIQDPRDPSVVSPQTLALPPVVGPQTFGASPVTNQPAVVQPAPMPQETAGAPAVTVSAPQSAAPAAGPQTLAAPPATQSPSATVPQESAGTPVAATRQPDLVLPDPGLSRDTPANDDDRRRKN